MFPRASVKHVLGQIRQPSGGTGQGRGAMRSAVVISPGSVVIASAGRLRHVVGPCVWVFAVSVSR
jgi:hypothetical protein